MVCFFGRRWKTGDGEGSSSTIGPSASIIMGRVLTVTGGASLLAYLVRCAFSTEVYTRGCHWFPRLLA
jgi:hypothetical protein